MRLSVLLLALPLAACASSIPQVELDRCKLGVGDGNDSYTVRQGAACRIVAQRLVADEQPATAITYARQACELQDAAGCEYYLVLAHGKAAFARAELPRARAAGEKACDGMVVSIDGSDPRGKLCARTADLYAEVQPTSDSDATRLYARACKLGEKRSCTKLHGAPEDDGAAAAASKAPPPPAAPLPPPPPTSTVVSQAVTPACHEMRACATLDVQEHNSTEVTGTITNRCEGGVLCRWCPARGTNVEKSLCRTGTLSVGETRSGKQWGLWFDGFNAMGYDCVAEHDPEACLGI